MKKFPVYLSAEEAVKGVKSGDRVYIHGSAATPQILLESLANRSVELSNVELLAISTLGEAPFTREDAKSSFFVNSLFVSNNVREAVNSYQGDYVPVFLSEIPRLFKTGILPIDVALIHVSPPDNNGYCSLGVSVDIARTAVKSAKHVIAQVNPQMPRTHGDGFIHFSEIDAMVEVEQELPEVDYSCNVTDAEAKIGEYCASLIDDGSTMQMGIGCIPDAVLKSLSHHKNLGIHTEMFSDGVIPLIESGVITNKFKRKHPGKIVTGFAIGTRKMYDYIDDNPLFAFLSIDYVNDGAVIRTNPKMVAINSAIEIDLTGQVCADSIGTFQYSGVGGQMDFIRGASLSEGGKPIIALPSTTRKGISRIVPFLKEGAGVVTTRAHVHYVVTENGIAYLYGKNLRQRAEALRNIAHPDNHEMLDQAIFNRFGKKYVTAGVN
jgi:acyl-CoA hydrolase